MFEQLEQSAWVVLLLPLAAVAVNTLFLREKPRESGIISIVAVLLALVVSLVLVWFSNQTGAASLPRTNFPWLWIGDTFQVDIGLQVDRLSLMMLLVVTFVGLLIHIYSSSYMKGDPGYSRFFTCLSLFMFSMLGIVLADNFVMLFIFWELVGISSYLLIGFWYEKPAAADACRKAFVTNRIGDAGFLLGILLVWSTAGSLNFEVVKLHIGSHHAEWLKVATAAGLLIFCGAVGKSAQFPLHVWLPDAMEGPTPVSALIHAATMVAAGVYMLCRVFFLLSAPGSHALHFIAWTGGFTALLAALIAVQQNDIKRILAYSTLSQLGYMVMAVGLSGPTPAMFHLTTHAFFKALLFLGAGSVIVGMHHEQDIWKMGSLRKKMPVTLWTFLMGTLALCGVPILSGFYSKDSILAQALSQNNIPLFALGLIVAILTTFYMFRLFYVVFLGTARTEAGEHAHESPATMLWPLRILAVFSVIGGLIGIQEIYAHHFEPQTPQAAGFLEQLISPLKESPMAAGLGLLAIAIGFLAARGLYRTAVVDPLPAKLGGLSQAMANGFYFDSLYEKVLIPITHRLPAMAVATFDRLIINGAVRFAHGFTELFGRTLRMTQTGNLQTYAFLLAAGLAVALYLVLR